MAVRTYCPSVRVGNWREDIKLEEDALKDFLERRERGELLIQRNSNFRSAVNESVPLSMPRGGVVHYGDNVMIVNPAPTSRSENPRANSAALAMTLSSVAMHNATCMPEESAVSGTTVVEPTSRTCFTIISAGKGKGDVLCHGDPFYLKITNGELFLTSDKASFAKCAKQSRHNEVSLVHGVSYLAQWKVTALDPEYRFEMESVPVSPNEKILLTHIKTGAHLCLEVNYKQRTDFEISTHTSLDSHKAERDVNHWVFVMGTSQNVAEQPCPEGVEEPVHTQESSD